MTLPQADPTGPAVVPTTTLTNGLSRWSQRHVVPVAILGTSLLVGALGFGIQQGLQTQALLEATQNAQSAAARSSAADVAQHYAAGDLRGLAETLRAIGTEPFVKSVMLLDEELRTLATNDQTAVGSSLVLADWPGLTRNHFSANPPKMVGLGDSQTMLETVLLPTAQPPDQRGWLLIQRGAVLSNARAASGWGWRVALAASSAALLTLLLWAWFERAFRQRLEAFKVGLQRASAGETGVTLSVGGADELSDLARAFNTAMTVGEQDRARVLQREQDLRGSNLSLSFLRSALDAHASVSVTNLAGKIVFANQRFCEISGYSAEELVGQDHALLNSGAHPAAFFEDLWRTILAGKTWQGLIRNCHRSGAFCWAQTTITPTQDESGNLTQFISIRTNVTARECHRQGLELLVHAESGDGFWDQMAAVIGVGLNVRWAGVAFFGTTPATLEVMAFRDSGERAAPFSLEVLDSPWAMTIQSDQLSCVPIKLSRRFNLPGDFAQRGAECYLGQSVRDSEGGVTGVVWAIDDKPYVAEPDAELLLALVARRVEAERQRVAAQDTLQAQQQHLSVIVQAGRLGIFEWNIATGQCDLGGTFAELLGCQPAELDTKFANWRARIHPADIDRESAAITALCRGQSAEYVGEYRLRRQDGTWLWLHIRGQISQRDAAGQALCMAGVALDITQRKHIELALEHERARIQMVIRAGNLGFWEWDLVADHTEIQSPALETLAVSPGEVQNVQAWLKLIHPDDYSRFLAAGTAHLKGTTAIFSVEARFRGHDDWRWQLVCGQVVERAADGRAVRLVGTHIDVTQLRAAQASAQFSQQRLQSIVEAAGLGVWEWDISLDKLQTNQWLERTLGEVPPPLRFPAGSMANWLSNDEYSSYAQAICRMLREGNDGLLQAEFKVQATDGSRKTIMSRGRVTERSAEGRALRMVGIQADISEKRAIEERLQREEERLRMVVSSAHLGLWDFELVSGRTIVNQMVLGLVGDSREPPILERADWAKFIHPDDLPRIEARLAAHCAGETAHFVSELRLLAADGSWVWMLSSGAVRARDELGRPLHVSGVLHDITSSKKADAAQQASEERLRAVVENSPVGMFLANPLGEPLLVNPLLRDMLGWSNSWDLTLDWSVSVAADDLVRVQLQWSRCVAEGNGSFSEEFSLITPDLRTIRVRARARPVRSEGVLWGFVGTVDDITDEINAAAEHTQLHRQLLQAQRMDALGQLTGGIAHDFNNVLASILGYTSLARSLWPDHSERVDEYLDAVMAAGERARELVVKMLEFSRNEPREDLHSVDPAPLIDEVLCMLATIIPSSIQLRVENKTAGGGAALLDPSDLHQLLVNLVLNARDALPGHGLILVSLLPLQRVQAVCSGCHSPVDASYLVIDVTDDGEGIAPSVLPQIFDPFFTTKSSGKGTGMGLSVVHGIMHRGSGHLVVTSTPGTGTRVRLLFPPALRAESPVFAEQTGRPPTLHGGGGRRILVVDDEPLVLKYLVELFRLQGYAVDSAVDGVEALALLQARPADYCVLLTDQTMPRMTGLELAHEVRRSYPRLPIVLCSGYSPTVNVKTAQEAGIGHFFRKPVSPTVLLSTVAALAQAGAA